jgi:hypothetical protein
MVIPFRELLLADAYLHAVLNNVDGAICYHWSILKIQFELRVWDLPNEHFCGVIQSLLPGAQDVLVRTIFCEGCEEFVK